MRSDRQAFDVPPDLLSQVARHLTFRQRLTAATVCKAWCRCLCHGPWGILGLTWNARYLHTDWDESGGEFTLNLCELGPSSGCTPTARQLAALTWLAQRASAAQSVVVSLEGPGSQQNFAFFLGALGQHQCHVDLSTGERTTRNSCITRAHLNACIRNAHSMPSSST